MYKSLLRWMYTPKDPAGLGVARFFFGAIMMLDIFEERGLPYLVPKWGDATSCYFPLFTDLPRLPIEYLHIVYLLMLLSCFGILLGFFYRCSCLCYAVCYWYIFLLDKTVWNNHSYLYGLLAILFLCTDAHYYWSVDSLLWTSIRNKSVPAWHYGIFKFQLFILYFFAGLKKLDRDWVEGYSMLGLSRRWIFDPFRSFMSDDEIDYFMVHLGGLIFDASAGFLLYFRKSRVLGFLLAYSFHGMNAIMFNIGMFSYACMALITIFCRPDWPKYLISFAPAALQRILPLACAPQINEDCVLPKTGTTSKTEIKSKTGTTSKKVNKEQSNSEKRFTLKKIMAVFFVFTYVSIQLFLPWSHSLTKGYNSWTQGLYGYSWDMMVHSWNTQHVVIQVIDAKTRRKQYLRPGAFIPMGGKSRVFSHPDMMKQYAICLADHVPKIKELDIQDAEIYFDVWKSLNTRFQQRMVDPRVNLVKADWDPFIATPWMRPLLVELSSWRETFTDIKSVRNVSDIVFVADFPGLHLENYIAEEITSNITVLNGDVIVEQELKNTTVKTNETLTLASNATHRVFTVGEVPSCYMYVFVNASWTNTLQDETIQNDPKAEQLRKWNEKSTREQASAFLSSKYRMYTTSLWQLYYAVSIILDVGVGKDDGLLNEREL